MTTNWLNALQSDLRKLQIRNAILAAVLFFGTLANALVFPNAMALSLLLLSVGLVLLPIAGLVQRRSHRLTMLLLAVSKVFFMLTAIMLVASVIGAS
jgi:hypothetical protein